MIWGILYSDVVCSIFEWGNTMKNLSLLVWMTQLGLSVVLPLAGLIWLGLWLKNSCGWGVWALIAGVVLGVVLAADGLRNSLKLMNRMAKNNQADKPSISYNEHD